MLSNILKLVSHMKKTTRHVPLNPKFHSTQLPVKQIIFRKVNFSEFSLRLELFGIVLSIFKICVMRKHQVDII